MAWPELGYGLARLSPCGVALGLGRLKGLGPMVLWPVGFPALCQWLSCCATFPWLGKVMGMSACLGQARDGHVE